MRKKHSNTWKLFLLLGVFVLSAGVADFLVSCAPYDDISVSDSDIVATVVDQSVDFSKKVTYARPPDVRVIKDPNQDEADPTDLNPAVEAQILSSIDENMTALGFTPVGFPGNTDPTQNPDKADVNVLPFVARTTWTGSSCYPYYWDYWYGYPGAGWCYPYTYTFTTGSILIAMVDSVPAPGTQPNVEWGAGINGLLDGSTTSQILTRVNNSINQAFKQSPYLGAGK
jgi:hypothetical protein